MRRDGQVLLLQRRKDQTLPGLWTFPGGKVEHEEQPLQAAVRELQEETGIRGTHWRHLGKGFVDTGQDLHLHFVVFICLSPDDEPPAPESPYCWCPRSTLTSLDMPDVNQRFIRLLQEPMVDTWLHEVASRP